jgi:hypothetical protein
VNTQNVFLIEGPSGGKTLRRSEDKSMEITTQVGVSNENPTLLTTRSNVRVSLRKPADEDMAAGTAYAQLTLSVPTDKFSATELKAIVARLCNWLRDPERTDESGLAFEGTANLPAVSRLYAGEP